VDTSLFWTWHFRQCAHSTVGEGDLADQSEPAGVHDWNRLTFKRIHSLPAAGAFDPVNQGRR
jgi:hypothetical protein